VCGEWSVRQHWCAVGVGDDRAPYSLQYSSMEEYVDFKPHTPHSTIISYSTVPSVTIMDPHGKRRSTVQNEFEFTKNMDL
jgi:hypothetical protein